MKPAIGRKLAVVTGGCGGIGQACARLFGKAHDLLLVDISAERLGAAEAQFRDEGYIVVGSVAGDLADPATIDSIMTEVGAHGALGPVIHTAGVSPAMADWRTILRTNVLGTALLLDSIESRLTTGSVGVLIASIAGHLAPADPDIDGLLASPASADFLDQMEAHVVRVAEAGEGASFAHSGLSGPAYALSKRATMRMAALRSQRWADRGARLVSISPGIIWTPMGRFEVDHGEAAADVLAQTALRRWGTGMDIAQAAAFLASDAASFITGTDLRIDGGMVPVRLGDTY